MAADDADPTAMVAARATVHLNEDHADALLDIARVLGGRGDATAAVATGLDRDGLDLLVTTAGGDDRVRVPWAAPVTSPDGVRHAAVELTRRARA